MESSLICSSGLHGIHIISTQAVMKIFMHMNVPLFPKKVQVETCLFENLS
jgi:hypothetical protein